MAWPKGRQWSDEMRRERSAQMKGRMRAWATEQEQEAYLAGGSLRDIAQQAGITHQAMRARLSNAGVEIRRVGRQPKRNLSAPA